MINFTVMQDKFNSLDGRERKILLAGSLLLLFFILYVLMYRPMASSITSLRQSNLEKQQVLVWMAESAASIKSSATSGNKAIQRSGRSLNQLINDTASKTGISISRSQPRNNNQYQIWLDRILFNELLVWLNLLQNNYGIYVSSINLGATDTKGFVRVNLTFQDTGSL